MSKTLVESLLVTASTWFSDEKLVLSESKTQDITFSLEKNSEKISTAKLLGFTLKSHLNWSDHFEHIFCTQYCNIFTKKIKY